MRAKDLTLQAHSTKTRQRVRIGMSWSVKPKEVIFSSSLSFGFGAERGMCSG